MRLSIHIYHLNPFVKAKIVNSCSGNYTYTMAQAPIENHSIHTASETPRAQGAISYTKEKAKQELFKAISDQNTQYGAWQKGISDWYEEKVKKFEKR